MKWADRQLSTVNTIMVVEAIGRASGVAAGILGIMPGTTPNLVDDCVADADVRRLASPLVTNGEAGVIFARVLRKLADTLEGK